MADLLLPLALVLLGAEVGGLDVHDSGLVGLGMVGRGEVALVAATVGLHAGAIDGGVYAAIVLLAVVTTVLAPIGVTLWVRGYRVPSLPSPLPGLAPVRLSPGDGE